MEKVIKEMRNKKATGDDDVPGDVLKLLGEQTLETDEELCICFLDWQKAFDHVN